MCYFTNIYLLGAPGKTPGFVLLIKHGIVQWKVPCVCNRQTNIPASEMLLISHVASESILPL